MQESFDFTDYALQVRQLSRMLMSSDCGAAEISGRMHLLAVAAERDLACFGDALERTLIACGPGCGACCVLNVAVLIPEAVAISWFLRRRYPAEELDRLRHRLQDLLIRTRWLDDEERLFVRVPCAFLDSLGRCMIYPVRPILCRSITSTDPQACQDAVVMAPLDGAPCVEMNLFQKQLFETVYAELAGALEDLGLDHRPRRLSAAVLALLDQPSQAKTFLSGARLAIS